MLILKNKYDNDDDTKHEDIHIAGAEETAEPALAAAVGTLAATESEPL